MLTLLICVGKVMFYEKKNNNKVTIVHVEPFISFFFYGL